MCSHPRAEAKLWESSHTQHSNKPPCTRFLGEMLEEILFGFAGCSGFRAGGVKPGVKNERNYIIINHELDSL